jgi:hypothetical protein
VGEVTVARPKRKKSTQRQPHDISVWRNPDGSPSVAAFYRAMLTGKARPIAHTTQLDYERWRDAELAKNGPTPVRSPEDNIRYLFGSRG